MNIILILFLFYGKILTSNLTSTTAGKETKRAYFYISIISGIIEANCEKEVLDFAPTGFENDVHKILTEGTQKDVWSPPWRANSWISKENKKNREAFILIDLGCTKNINGFYLRKAKNFFPVLNIIYLLKLRCVL